MNAPQTAAAHLNTAQPAAVPEAPFGIVKQTQILALLRLGYSRRMAARQVGCNHATIGRAAARDPSFAAQLCHVEGQADFQALKLVRTAAGQEKYWRAAAWILERRNPEEFGHRPPHSFSTDQVMTLLAQMFDYTLPLVAAEKQEAFLGAFNGTLREVESQAAAADKWRNMATEAADKPQAEGEPFAGRSPYEHPQWRDPVANDASALPLVAHSRDAHDPDGTQELLHYLDTLSEGDSEKSKQMLNELDKQLKIASCLQAAKAAVRAEEEPAEAGTPARAEDGEAMAAPGDVVVNAPAEAGTPAQPAEAGTPAQANGSHNGHEPAPHSPTEHSRAHHSCQNGESKDAEDAARKSLPVNRLRRSSPRAPLAQEPKGGARNGHTNGVG